MLDLDLVNDPRDGLISTSLGTRLETLPALTEVRRVKFDLAAVLFQTGSIVAISFIAFGPSMLSLTDLIHSLCRVKPLRDSPH